MAGTATGGGNMTAAQQARALRRVIRASGLSARRWAKEVARVDERTVRRWLAGDVKMSPALAQFLLAAK